MCGDNDKPWRDAPLYSARVLFVGKCENVKVKVFLNQIRTYAIDSVDYKSLLRVLSFQSDLFFTYWLALISTDWVKILKWRTERKEIFICSIVLNMRIGWKNLILLSYLGPIGLFCWLPCEKRKREGGKSFAIRHKISESREKIHMRILTWFKSHVLLFMHLDFNLYQVFGIYWTIHQ